MNQPPLKVFAVVSALDAPMIINIRQPLDILGKKGLLSYSINLEGQVDYRELHGCDVVIFFRATYSKVSKIRIFFKIGRKNRHI